MKEGSVWPSARPGERWATQHLAMDSSWTALPSHRAPLPAVPPAAPRVPGDAEADALPALQDRLATALAVLAIVGAWGWLALFIASR